MAFVPSADVCKATVYFNDASNPGGTMPKGSFALYIDIERCFGRISRRRLWRALRRRGLPKRFAKLLRDLYSNTRFRVRSEKI